VSLAERNAAIARIGRAIFEEFGADRILIGGGYALPGFTLAHAGKRPAWSRAIVEMVGDEPPPAALAIAPLS
jgi:hypothetical protein